MKEKYLALIRNAGYIDTSTYYSLLDNAIHYDGREAGSDPNSGIVLFFFEELSEAERFKAISENLESRIGKRIEIIKS